MSPSFFKLAKQENDVDVFWVSCWSPIDPLPSCSRSYANSCSTGPEIQARQNPRRLIPNLQMFANLILCLTKIAEKSFFSFTSSNDSGRHSWMVTRVFLDITKLNHFNYTDIIQVTNSIQTTKQGSYQFQIPTIHSISVPRAIAQTQRAIHALTRSRQTRISRFAQEPPHPWYWSAQWTQRKYSASKYTIKKQFKKAHMFVGLGSPCLGTTLVSIYLDVMNPI